MKQLGWLTLECILPAKLQVSEGSNKMVFALQWLISTMFW